MKKRTGLPHGAIMDEADWMNHTERHKDLPNGLHYVGSSRCAFWYRVVGNRWGTVVSSQTGGDSTNILLFDNYWLAFGYFEYLKQKVQQEEKDEAKYS